MNREDPRKNEEGYLDLTAYQALKNINMKQPTDDRFRELLHTIFTACDYYGFRLEGRIKLEDVVSGKKYR